MPIKWVNQLPAPATRGRKPVKRPKHWAFAQELRKRPGQWAVLGTFNSSIAYQIKKGQTPAFLPAGAFEAATRDTKPDGRGTIYVRFVGAGDES